ncbi:MAG: VTC domain-containing protein [Candidatus Schekmanbacteria bacterium]|nr:VTC domain-containing protein [Candidatus Schekmanbacteria bacterium]
MRWLFPARAPEQAFTAEQKLVANNSFAESAVAILDHTCIPDLQHPLGMIESIYFDDARFSAFREKLAGDNLKRKVRIRWYREEPTLGHAETVAFLEVKDRIGAGRKKDRFPFAVALDWLAETGLHDPALTHLLYRQAGAAGVSLPPDLAATASIRYRRRRWVCPLTAARLCLDTQICATRFNRDLLPFGACHELTSVVAEVKSSDRSRGNWAAALVSAGFRSRSFSKYGTCMSCLSEGWVTA